VKISISIVSRPIGSDTFVDTKNAEQLVTELVALYLLVPSLALAGALALLWQPRLTRRKT
jgi:hypothetical protein